MNTKDTSERLYIYCAKGHEMISGPVARTERMASAADEDGCGTVGCKAGRGASQVRTVRTMRWTA